MQIKKLLCFVSLVVLILSCAQNEESNKSEENGGIGAESQIKEWKNEHVGFYYESYDYVALKDYLEQIAPYGFSVDLAITYDKIGNAELADALHKADELGVEVRAWLLVEYELGYWPGEENAERFSEVVNQFVDWVESEKLPVKWIIVDMEMSLQKTNALTEMINSGDLLSALSLLLSNITPGQFAQSMEVFRELVNSLKLRGYHVGVVTYPLELDDLDDGDFDLEDIFQIPVGDVNYSEFAFMVYTSFYEDILTDTLRLPVTPYLIYEYARKAHKYYPTGACIALGITSDAGYSPERMAEEVAAIRAAGVERIMIYSLDGIYSREDFTPENWFDALSAEPKIPPYSPEFGLQETLLKLVDLIANDKQQRTGLNLQ